MAIIKRLLIRASSQYDQDFKLVPVNTNKGVEINSDIGVFNLKLSIKDFDGAAPHLSNSLYNIGDKVFLNGEPIDSRVKDVDELTHSLLPNLRLEIDFKPNKEIKGSEFLFGNDFTIPIKDYVPTTLLASGLKFFTWFVNKTVKGDIYNDKPYLYALALNSFTTFTVQNEKTGKVHAELINKPKKRQTDLSNFKENLSDNGDGIEVPDNSWDRRTYFNNFATCSKFTLKPESTYNVSFDTSFLKFGNSKYAASIPTFGNKTFDIDVSSYANDKLNNVNWIIKEGGYEGVGHGNLGLVINFAVLDEESRD